jgi:AcrR family transcriptional regulator
MHQPATNPLPPVTKTVVFMRKESMRWTRLSIQSYTYIVKRTAKPKTPIRRRGAAATRQAILDSAREAFARAGYDGAGVREIAAGAGVTAMLVNRYFGSKEGLFTEVVTQIMARPSILTQANLNSSTPGADMAAALVGLTSAGATPLEGFQIMLRSASSARAAEIGRVQIEKRYHRELTSALRGESAPQRAALVLALVAGIQVMRQMIGLTALAKSRPNALIALLGPILQHLIDGESQ